MSSEWIKAYTSNPVSMGPHQSGIPSCGHIQNTYVSRTGGRKDFNTIFTYADSSYWPLMFCLQVNMFEIQRPEPQECIVRSSHAERLVNTHSIDRNPTC